jgi:transcriptional regulator with GAF, ATPase, and Fis domain
MSLLDKEYFEVFTHAVINSKDLETAMSEVYKFFRKHLPLDFQDLSIYDAQSGTLRYRAYANDQGVILADETVRFSEAARKEASTITTRKIQILGNLLDSTVGKEIYAHLGLEVPGTSMPVLVELGSSQYGVLSLVAWGKDRFTTEHLAMVEALYVPIAGAVRHILSQLEIASLKERLVRATGEIRERILGHRIIGASTGLREVMGLVEQAAPLDVSILIMGETGVGKEVVATAIHNMSKRSEGPMISINCGAIPDTLIDSELFGHEKGAFTGADSLKQGYFEQANRGTIFLDEIGELSLQAQVKLLRVIQDMTFQRVGGKRPIKVDVRVIAATNRDLTSFVTTLQFRKDLWFRLSVFPIHVPPLRERLIDIPAFAEYFIRRQTVEMNLPYRSRLASGAVEQLQCYDWPGNVRELQNVIERAIILSNGEPLSFPNLAGNVPAKPESSAPLDSPYPTYDEITAQYIRQTLMKTSGQVAGIGGAAELMGMHPSTLRARMKKLGIKAKMLR